MDIVAGTALLTRTGWLSQTAPDFQAALLGAAIWRRIAADSTIILGGDHGGGIWGIARGEVGVASVMSTPDAPAAHIHQPGWWLGPAPVFGRPRNASATVRTDALLMQVPLAPLTALLDAHPGWWRHMGELALELMVLATGLATDLLIRDSRSRCIATLLRAADCRFADPLRPRPWSVAITQEELATMANLSRYPAGETLRDLERAGLIAIGYRNITVVDPAALRAMVDA